MPIKTTGSRYSEDNNPVQAEYIWLDNKGVPRSKIRVFESYDENDDFPQWNYDGSSTGQAETSNSEIILKPVSVYKDPFTPNGYFVLCETYLPNGTPHDSNNRAKVIKAISNSDVSSKPWMGFEQEFFLIDTQTGRPLGFPKNVLYSPRAQYAYYCGVGNSNVFARHLVTKAFQMGLAAGLKICGMNAEVAPGQWEIQIGPLPALQAADDIIILRYILQRCTEGTNISVDFGAKPIEDFNGSGMHTNFSTEAMRSPETGREAISKALKALEDSHHYHMEVYSGQENDNEKRMTGHQETSDPSQFTWGVGARNKSVRIPETVQLNGYGYLEDRRPSSSCDPYEIVRALIETVCN